jgi:sugar O-acyltransferase (sialic acid O-acetyltransferase NeuD family)
MKLAIFGYGGHAREVAAQINKSVQFFVDDEFVKDFLLPISQFDPSVYEIIIAVAEPKERRKIAERLPTETRFFTFIHPTALLMRKDIEIGEGSFIGANSVLTTNIKIGKHAILNRGNQIGHDTTIGDYFSAMPGSIVSGNVVIGDNTYLGTNASIKEKIHVTSDVKIGSNASVVKNIITRGVYTGVPAKFLKK